MSYMIKLPLFSSLLVCVLCLHNLAYSDEAGWNNKPAVTASSIQSGRIYVNQNRNDIRTIYKYADSLRKKGRLAEVLHVYETALIHHPDNPVLIRKRILAESDLREKNLLAASENREYESVNPSVTSALDRIKCRILSGEEALSACQRVHTKSTENPSVAIVINRNQDNDYPESTQRLSRYRNNLNNHSETRNPRNPLRKIDLGNFHALIIGNNRYKHFPELETAVGDAKAVSTVLKNKYGYRVTQLNNANRYSIFKELSQLRRQLNADDNLLIYYAGHGYLDNNTKRGYWLPVDAEAENYANWISTSDITDMLYGMAAKHVLVVADSCYSGTLTRGIEVTGEQIEPDHFEWIQQINDKKSRTVMTSGGLEPVLDSGSGEHSIFAEAFIHALRENKNVLDSSKIFTHVRRTVVLNADQTPEYADIRKAGHEGGDFIFARVN